MFNKDTFAHFHNTNVNTGFNPSVNRYDGYVQDAEGRPWGYIKSLNLYEQAETGIRKDPAQFQLMNIDILGYGSNDGGSSPAPVVATDYTTGADGIFEFLSDGALDTPRDFSIVTNSTAYPVDAGIGDPKLLRVQLTSTSVINLQEGAGGAFANINPAPPFIGLFVSGPLGDRGWYIAEFDSAGNYNYVRSGKGTSFPPIDRSLDQPLAVVFYAADPGSVAGWSDYTT